MTVENLEINVKTNAGDAASQLNSLSGAIQSVKKAASGRIQSQSAGLTNVFNGAKDATKNFLGLGNAAKKATGFLGGVIGALKRIAFYRIVRTIIKEIGQAFMEGLKAAYNFSSTLTGEGNRFAAAMNSMSASVNQMKGQMGSAFAGLLTAIAPALEQVINYVTSAFNAISQVLAAFTGGTYLKAVRVQQSLGNAANSAASGTKKAAAAQAELNRQLMGFDEIEKPNEDSGGGGGGSGGGGGGGGGSAGDAIQFVEEQIDSQFANFADMLRDAWANADFTEIGGIIGQKLKDGLDSIDWNSVKETANRVAKSMATLLNGFLETQGLGASIGRTLSEAFNTGMGALNTFAENFHFDSLGRFVAEGIQTAFQTLDFSQITRLLSNALKGAMDIGSGFLQGIDWAQVPSDIANAIKEAISGFDFKGVFSSAGRLVGTALVAAIDWMSGIDELVSGFFTNVSDYFSQHIEEAKSTGGTFSEGILTGITDAFMSFDSWVNDNIVAPFVSAFSQAFDVSGAVANMQATVLGFLDYIKDIKIDFNPFDNDGVGIKLPEDSLSVYIEGRLNKLTTSDIPEDQKNVNGMTGNVTSANDWTNGGAQIFNATAFASKFTDRTNGTGMVENTTAVARKFSDGTGGKALVDYATAKATKFSDATKGKATVNYATAKATKFKDAVKNAIVSGVKAKINDFYDAIRSSEKVIKGFRAQIKTGYTTQASGGAYYGGSWHKLAGGGIIDKGVYESMPKYASGTSSAHGTMFLAGEAGPEVVGHVGGRTEVLNRSQLASTMYASVVAGMATVSAAMLPSISNAINYGALAYNTAQTASFVDDTRWIDRMASRVAEMTGNASNAQEQPIIVRVELDGRVVAESTVQQLQREANQGRFPLAGLT